MEAWKNQILDTDYTTILPWGWFPEHASLLTQAANANVVATPAAAVEKKPGFFASLFWGKKTSEEKKTTSSWPQMSDFSWDDQQKLDDQFKEILLKSDEEYDPKKLTPMMRSYILAWENQYKDALADYKTHIAPSYWEIKPRSFNMSWMHGRTYYANKYPSFLDFLWIRDLLWFYWKWDMSWYVFPSDDTQIQSSLKTVSTRLKAELSDAQQRWITLDMEKEIEYRDIEQIRQKLATREERYFTTSVYMNMYENEEDKLAEECKKLEQKMAWFWIWIKPATQRMDEWVQANAPLCEDALGIYRSMVSTSLWGSFPFIANDLIDSSWILYWVNLHSWSLVIFDRFSNKLPNANSVVLATSWAWKSFAVKLEILRYLMLGIDVLVIDPENEYKTLCEKVGWTYINISANSHQTINPFDLPPKIEDVDYQAWDLLRSQILNLIGLVWVLLGWLTPEEEAILDKALQNTYSLKEITFEDEDVTWKTVPLMADLMYALESMDWWDRLALRLSKYVTGTFWKLFNNYTNVDLNAWLTVFSIRDLEDALKTPWMYNVLNYVWTRVRSVKKKRLLVVDEAWIMMQHNMSANFLFGLIKRARKYWLGVTTITQDVEDFVKSPFGKPIVSNSSMQLLLKQSTVSIKSLAEVFSLSEAEKQKLVASNVWEWLLFAWAQHVAVKIMPSPDEKEFITTDVK